MRYAIVDGSRVEPTPGEYGNCETCKAVVIARCGEINIRHWAHMPGFACSDEWHEPITQWHIEWQNEVPYERRELVMKKEIDGKVVRHRADIVTSSGVVVEVQHSSISTKDIKKREEFYGPRMIWIFDAAKAFYSGRIEVDTAYKFGRKCAPETNAFQLYWRNPRKTIWASERRVYLDTGTDFLLMKEPYHDSRPCTIHIVHRKDLVMSLNGEVGTVPRQELELLAKLEAARMEMEDPSPDEEEQ